MAYSTDLRERVVAAVEREGISRRQAAARFDVGVSTVIRWVWRWRETGSVAPAQLGGHRPKKIQGKDRAWLLQRMMEGDFTIRGLVDELAARGLKVDYRTMWTFVHEAGLSYKKNRRGQRARAPRRRPAA